MEELDEDTKQFQAVISRIQFDRLPRFALAIRERRQVQATLAQDQTSEVTCRVLSRPHFGTYHVVYMLQFSDGPQWAFRVPITGFPGEHNESAARSLHSEALTMRLAARETTIPVPLVHDFDTSLENELRVPFILMDFVGGKPCAKAWFDTSLEASDQEQLRARTLSDLANSMVQLNRFGFDTCGSPIYGEDGSIVDIEVRERIDEGLPVYHDVDPSTDPKQSFLNTIDHQQPPSDSFSQGIRKLLRLFTEWLPQDTWEPGYVLTHPDLQFQNVVVAEDGAIVGLINWDGVATLPRHSGNERYPSWLTRDRDPTMYAYGDTLLDASEACKENSPEELSRYRAMYLGFLAKYLPEEAKRRATGRSLLLDNLSIAAGEAIFTDGIVLKIFEECVRARGEKLFGPRNKATVEPQSDGSAPSDGKEEDEESRRSDGLHDYEFLTELVDGEFDQVQLQKLKEGFDLLCHELDNIVPTLPIA